MSSPYRSHEGKEGCIWFALCVVGIACQIAIMAILHPFQDQLQAWILPIGAIPFLIMIFFAVWMLNRRKKQRISGIADALRPEGIELYNEPNEAVRGFLVPHMQGLEQVFSLQGGATNLVWVAYNDHILIFEHYYVTGSGKYSQPHWHTVIAFPPGPEEPLSAHLGYQPFLWLKKARKGSNRTLGNRKGEDLSTGDEAFDKAWAVHGSSETMAVFVTKPVRTRLAESPRGEAWQIGNGWVAVGYDLPLNGSNVAAFLRHARAVLAEL